MAETNNFSHTFKKKINRYFLLEDRIELGTSPTQLPLPPEPGLRSYLIALKITNTTPILKYDIRQVDE